jgi:short-subunit dehydrogenase
MTEFKGKVVWVTGASSGIGEAITYEFAKAGARLIISARRKEELDRVKDACKSKYNATVEPLALDLGQASMLKLTAEAAIQIYGQIDILVNNGGISQRSLAKDTQMDVDRKIMEVNYFGTITLTKSLIPHFLERKSGHIVTITSVTGKIGTPYRTGYAASKHALHGFFNSLRAELWKESPSIYVTLVCPGWTNTNLSLVALMGDGSPQNKKDDTHEHGLTPEKVARETVNAVRSKKREIIIAGWKEGLAVQIYRFFPALFAVIIRNAKVK